MGSQVKGSSMVDVVRDTVPARGQTNNGTVGTSAAQLTGASEAVLYSGVLLKAEASNSDVIYVGFSDGVTSANGYILGSGDVLPIPVEKATDIWIIGGAASQDYSWLGM